MDRNRRSDASTKMPPIQVPKGINTYNRNTMTGAGSTPTAKTMKSGPKTLKAITQARNSAKRAYGNQVEAI